MAMRQMAISSGQQRRHYDRRIGNGPPKAMRKKATPTAKTIAPISADPA